MSERTGPEDKRRKKLLQLASAAVFLAIAVVIVLIVVNSSKSEGGDAGDVKGISEVSGELRGIPQSGMVLGDPSAPVKLVEYGDLQCPHCAVVATEYMPKVIESQVRPGKARVEFRNFTIIDEQSAPAGAAALAAGEQGHGWNFIELFYENQGLEASGYVTDEFLTAIAEKAGVPNIARWESDRKSPKLAGEVERTTAEAKQLGFTGTPSFAVEGTDGKLEPMGTLGSAGELEEAIEGAS